MVSLRRYKKSCGTMEDKAIEEDLASFRREWQNEIVKNVSTRVASPTASGVTLQDNSSAQEDSAKRLFNIEEKARELFLEGIRYERQGEVNQAVYFYRQAVQLIPDIEMKIHDSKAAYDPPNSSDESDFEEEKAVSPNISSNDSSNLKRISEKFHALHISGLCSMNIQQRDTHISALPTELLVVIFRWVVSSQLDMKSLEVLSMVCKWFYACARDQEIWRSACIRMWGIGCMLPTSYDNCWRRMFLSKPHLQFSGLYISKSSYVRVGEQGLDSFYRPYHLVEYYRYIRFFTDGTAVVCISADDPQAIVQILHRPVTKENQRDNVSKGSFRIVGDTVNVFTCRGVRTQHDGYRRRSRAPTQVKEQHFSMQLLMKKNKKGGDWHLAWNKYSVELVNKSTSQKSSSDVDVSSFKPFFFSRVRRYTVDCLAPL